MLHNLLIATHAASGVAAFILGSLALRPRLQRGVPLTFPFYLGTLWLMVLFLLAVVAADWSTLASKSRVLFVTLLLLAVYMGGRGWHAWQDLRRRGAHWQEHYVDDIGFTLIALFAGFVIIASLDLGAPVWLVVGVGVLSVLAGRRGVSWARMRAAEMVNREEAA